MQKLLADHTGAGGLARLGAGVDGLSNAAPLLEVLWRRRWTVVWTTLACLLLAAVYLAVATPIYSATAKVFVQQNAPKAYAENQGYVAQSDSYLQTQADVFTSEPVLRAALERAHYQTLKTFETVVGDPVVWLRRANPLKVEVSRKSDTLLVTMESAYPKEAANFANQVVAAYTAEQTVQHANSGAEMVSVLQTQKEQLQKRVDECLQAMLKHRQQTGELSFNDDKGNMVLQRAAALSDSLTRAQISTMELRSQQQAINAAMATPQGITAYVQAMQAKGRDNGDGELADMRTQMSQSQIALSSAREVQGENHSHVQVIKRVIADLQVRIAEKERLIIESELASVSSQLAAAEETERQLTQAQNTQRGQAMAMAPDATDYAKLQNEVERIQRQCELLDNRIAEVSVNSLAATPLEVRVLEPASAEDKPVRPRKTFALAAALLVGWVLGIGLALGREWQDARLHKPEEILEFLGTPVLASIPKINPRLSSVTRGQLVRLDARSPAAEAYRGIRTSLALGATAGAKTILLASPASGDGKSTIASNLAIAFAQAGERTLLLDCDLRQPVQHMIFETDGTTGITNVLTGDAKLRDAVRVTRVPGLCLLPCGRIPENPSEMLASKRFARLMQSLHESFDRIVIDSAPVMSATDARILAASADATLLVLRIKRSMRQLCMLAMEGLQQVGANVVGAIANEVPADRSSSYYGGGSWRYASQPKRLQVPPVGAVGISRDVPRLAHDREAMSIKEPDWSAADVSASPGER